jgi:hypothetical protein
VAARALLLTALKRSDRRPDREHPFGYGKERFFWALIAAVSLRAAGLRRRPRRGVAGTGPARRSTPISATRFPDLQEIFVEPVPRTDPAIRERVLERYGRAGAERLRTGLTQES